MVEQDTAAAEDAIAFTVVNRHPVRIELGHAVRAARVKRRVFHLRHGLYLAKHLGRAGLVKADFWVDDANGFQKVHRAQTGNFSRGNGLIEGHTDKTLRGEVVDLSRTGGFQQANAGGQVGQVIFDQMQIRVFGYTQLIHTPKVNRAGAAVGAVDLVALAQ